LKRFARLEKVSKPMGKIIIRFIGVDQYQAQKVEPR